MPIRALVPRLYLRKFIRPRPTPTESFLSIQETRKTLFNNDIKLQATTRSSLSFIRAKHPNLPLEVMLLLHYYQAVASFRMMGNLSVHLSADAYSSISSYYPSIKKTLDWLLIVSVETVHDANSHILYNSRASCMF
jgi:hypothetical protein